MIWVHVGPFVGAAKGRLWVGVMEQIAELADVSLGNGKPSLVQTNTGWCHPVVSWFVSH